MLGELVFITAVLFLALKLYGMSEDIHTLDKRLDRIWDRLDALEKVKRK